MKIRALFDKIIWVPYYYVPPCPKCKSLLTGRFIKVHRDIENEWAMKEALRNGELVKPVEEIPDDYDSICFECDHMFYGPVELKIVPMSRIRKEKQLRGTNEILGCINDYYKENAKEPKRGLAKAVGKFIGKI